MDGGKLEGVTSHYDDWAPKNAFQYVELKTGPLLEASPVFLRRDVRFRVIQQFQRIPIPIIGVIPQQCCAPIHQVGFEC